jgi:hypothetical protein
MSSGALSAPTSRRPWQINPNALQGELLHADPKRIAGARPRRAVQKTPRMMHDRG